MNAKEFVAEIKAFESKARKHEIEEGAIAITFSKAGQGAVRFNKDGTYTRGDSDLSIMWFNRDGKIEHLIENNNLWGDSSAFLMNFDYLSAEQTVDCDYWLPYTIFKAVGENVVEAWLDGKRVAVISTVDAVVKHDFIEC